MKKRKMKWMAGVSLALSGMLALGDVILASAESVTYGQYLWGGESAQPPKAESEYTVIAVSTEEDLRRLAGIRFPGWRSPLQVPAWGCSAMYRRRGL